MTERLDAEESIGLDAAEAIDRIESLDDGDEVEVIRPAGEDETYWYYLAIKTHEYEGNTYLNERYVQLVKPGVDDRKDTWKTNGINRRVQSDEIVEAQSIARMYDLVASRLKRKEDRDFDSTAYMPGEW